MNKSVSMMIVVEGATEQTFVERVLAPYLSVKGVFVYATQISKKGQKGGDVRFDRAKRDVINFLKQRRDLYVATFVDYYGVKEWPGLVDVRAMNNPSPGAIASKMNDAAVVEVGKEIHDSQIEKRYIPFTAVHEFETLLFSDSKVLASELGINQCEVDAVLREVGSPEAINNRPETAPSKRLEKWTGNCYRKTVQGVTIAQKCGVDVMRRQCPNFNSWISKIESLCS